MSTISWLTFSFLLALPTSISAVTLDCEHIQANSVAFNLKALGGRKEVHFQELQPPSIHNTTFSIDICNTLDRPKSIPTNEQCPGGTRVCGIERVYGHGVEQIDRVIPIAGEYGATDGLYLDPDVERLKDGASHEDAEREGIRITLHGGRYPFTRKGRGQMAIIEFVCDSEVTGNEGFDEEEKTRRSRRDGDEEDGGEDELPELPDLDKGKSLEFLSYKSQDEVDVLRLRWRTKYACENAAGDDSDEPNTGKKGSSWGFFTWFVIIAFLLAASYIIFGSWLNYNRYGARGWDLVPHGDTIRDLPYILKDLGNNLMGRLKSGDSRGGYSAV